MKNWEDAYTSFVCQIAIFGVMIGLALAGAIYGVYRLIAWVIGG